LPLPFIFPACRKTPYRGGMSIFPINPAPTIPKNNPAKAALWGVVEFSCYQKHTILFFLGFSANKISKPEFSGFQKRCNPFVKICDLIMNPAKLKLPIQCGIGRLDGILRRSVSGRVPKE